MTKRMPEPVAIGLSAVLAFLAPAYAAGQERVVSGFVIAAEDMDSIANAIVMVCPTRPRLPGGQDCVLAQVPSTGDYLFSPYRFAGLNDEDYNVFALLDVNGNGRLDPGDYGAVYAGLLDSYQKQPSIVRPPRTNVTVRLKPFTGEAASLYPGQTADGTLENAVLAIEPAQLVGTWQGGEYRGEYGSAVSTQSQYGSNAITLSPDGRYSLSDLYHQGGGCRVALSEGTYEFTPDTLILTAERSWLGDCGSTPELGQPEDSVETRYWRLTYDAAKGLYLQLLSPSFYTGHPSDWNNAKDYEPVIEQQGEPD